MKSDATIPRTEYEKHFQHQQEQQNMFPSNMASLVVSFVLATTL
jgi:hypothetical protein